MIIGLTGPKYAGKTHVARVIAGMNYRFLGFDDEVRLEVNARELPADTELHQFAIDRRNEFGEKYWSRRVAGRVEDVPAHRKYVVDGMRTLADLDVFREFPDFVLVGVDANLDTRWKRCQDRKRPDDPTTYEGFLEVCRRDGSGGPEGLESGALFGRRQHLIVNEGTLSELTRAVTALVYSIKK